MVIQEHASELDFDLMTMTGRTLDEYAGMGAAGIVALAHFVRHVALRPDSAVYRATHEGDEAPQWSTLAHTNMMLADIYDLTVACHKKRHARPKPYPRPNARARGSRTIGSQGSIGEIEGWIAR